MICRKKDLGKRHFHNSRSHCSRSPHTIYTCTHFIYLSVYIDWCISVYIHSVPINSSVSLLNIWVHTGALSWSWHTIVLSICEQPYHAFQEYCRFPHSLLTIFKFSVSVAVSMRVHAHHVDTCLHMCVDAIGETRVFMLKSHNPHLF